MKHRVRRDHPEVPVRVGERARATAPCSPAPGDGRARRRGPRDQLRRRLQKLSSALAVPARRDLLIADHPSETARGMNMSRGLVDVELQRLRDTVIGGFADRFQPQSRRDRRRTRCADRRSAGRRLRVRVSWSNDPVVAGTHRHMP